MKGNRGVTLIELMVVAGIVAILVVVLGFNYQGWIGNYRVESQTKSLYADLMDARTRAMTRNRMYFVQLNIDNYAIYADSDDDMAFNPGAGDDPEPEYRVPGTLPGTLNVKTKTVDYTLGWTGSIGFDTRGIAWDYTANPPIPAVITIPLTLTAGLTPDYDCIELDQIQVRMGQMSGGACVPK